MLGAVVFTGMIFTTLNSHAQSPSINLKDVSTEQDTSIVIKKGTQPIAEPEYEIVSGGDDVAGDPEAGAKESYANWKVACENWKKEIKELNRDNQILFLSCGLPKPLNQKNGTQINVSEGKFKIKTRVRRAKE